MAWLSVVTVIYKCLWQCYCHLSSSYTSVCDGVTVSCHYHIQVCVTVLLSLVTIIYKCVWWHDCQLSLSYTSVCDCVTVSCVCCHCQIKCVWRCECQLSNYFYFVFNCDMFRTCSIMNSCIVLLFLSGFLAIIMYRALRKDSSCHVHMDGLVCIVSALYLSNFIHLWCHKDMMDYSENVLFLILLKLAK